MNIQKQIKSWDLKRWISAYNEWNNIHDHIKKCDCKNKNNIISCCGVVLCEKLEGYYSNWSGVCFKCDTWLHPNPFNPKNKKLLDLYTYKCDKCNKQLFELKKEGTGTADIYNTIHKCRVCGKCHIYIGHLFCEVCLECVSSDVPGYPNLTKCPKCGDAKLSKIYDPVGKIN